MQGFDHMFEFHFDFLKLGKGYTYFDTYESCFRKFGRKNYTCRKNLKRAFYRRAPNDEFS